MIISLNWLKKYIDLSGINPEELAHQFTITSAEIENVELPPSIEFLNQFEVVEVLEVKAHPNANKLRCVKVKTATEVLDIVCGAPNVREGLLTVLAPIGTVIGDMKIKAAKLRGEPSSGMLCSEQELGVGTDGNGIIELNEIAIGTKSSEVYQGLSALWDLDNKAITHRPDLWGHYGIARELSVILKRELNDLEFYPCSIDLGNDGFNVSIANADACRRYCGLSIKNVHVCDSPEWVQQVLRDVGLSPINNIVDATNFVMLELGQPTHAFDQRHLTGKNIEVTMAKEGEAFHSLLGKEVELTGEDLVIRAGGQVVALAGVVGGENSSIVEDTTEIFLEAAHFEPLRVRKTAQKYDLRTDSSSRFEKSLDPENAQKAIGRLVAILKESCPHLELQSNLIDVYPNPIPERSIVLNRELAEKKMGIEIEEETQKDILEQLGFSVEDLSNGWEVKVPSYRNTKDIEGPIDLVEEIGRIYGYEHIRPEAPISRLESLPYQERLERTRLIQDRLTAKGYSELKSYSFCNREDLERTGVALEKAMALKNPMNQEQTHMRTMLLQRQLEIWSLNAKQFDSFKLFELGKVFEKSEDLLPKERDELIMVHYSPGAKGESLYQLKADALDCLSIFEDSVEIVPSDRVFPLAHPSRQGVLKMGEKEIGYIAELHPSFAKQYGLKQRLSFLVCYEPLELRGKISEKFKPLQKYPVVPFSLSFVVDKRTCIGEVIACIQSVNSERIQDIQWVENYQGEPLKEDQMSMTLQMNFAHPDRTLNGDEIEQLQNSIIKKAAEKNYHLREK